MIATLAPLSVRANSSSGPVHQALSGVAIAPMAVAAKKATGHSGRLRVMIATRSPATTPSARRVPARAATARWKAS